MASVRFSGPAQGPLGFRSRTVAGGREIGWANRGSSVTAGRRLTGLRSVNSKPFSDRMADLADRINFNINRTMVELGMAINAEVISRTPVDTGRARGNWFASLGSATKVSSDTTYSPDPQTRISLNNDIIRQRKPGQAIFICNSLDYIRKLNDGSSRQAPKQFVQTAFLAGVSKVLQGKGLLV